jgi:hypothetical protein
MAKHITFRNSAIIIAVLASAPIVALAAADIVSSDQDGRQDSEQICDRSPDCIRVVDPEIEPGQDQKVEPSKVIDPDFQQQPDHERMIDPDVAPVEDPEGNRIIDPPDNARPDSSSKTRASQKHSKADIRSIKS